MTKVSVIIPAYNAMSFLSETLESVLKQTFQDYEVIIVNDGSSDGIEQWATQITDSRVKLVSKNNEGAAIARNTGIAHARGEYLAFLDADDLWHPSKLEKQVRYLEENPKAGLVYTWTALIDEKNNFRGKIYASCLEGNVWKSLIEQNIVRCGSSAMVRCSCFEVLGGFDKNLKFAEDWEMWIRIAAHYSFIVVKERLVYYRQHSSNKSQKFAKTEENIENFRTIIEKSFQSAPFDLLYLRNRSYGRVNLILAWKCIQSSDPDYKKALCFRSQALKHYPCLFFSLEYLRLTVGIFLVQHFSTNGYSQFVKKLNMVRQIISKRTSQKV